jgi:hypothetical protein
MIFTIINSLLIWSGIYWMIRFFISSKKRESVEFSIKKGLVCKECKEEIKFELDTIPKLEEHYERISDKKTYHSICVKCKRDLALDELLDNPYHKIKDKIFNKWRRNYFILIFTSILIQFIGVFTSLVGIQIFGSSILFFAHWGNYKHFIINSIPKSKK